MQKTYIIAEGGINHNGDIALAKRLVDIAAVAGCDCFKLQKRTPDLCVPEDQKNKLRDTPWGRIKYIDYKKKIEFGKEEYDILSDYCKEKRIGFAASVWDVPSLHFMSKYDVAFMKIPSAKIVDNELVNLTAEWCNNNKKPFVFSIGMSTEDEIDQTIQWIKQHIKDDKNIWCMITTSTYPCPIEQINFSRVFTLRKKYGDKIRWSYSGHEFRLGTSVAAIYLGMSVIERHFTLDRTMFGNDQLSSVEPHGLLKLVSGIRELEKAYGNSLIEMSDSELESRKRLRGY